jgi:hypothetical protein
MIKYLTSNLLGPEGPQGPEGLPGMNGAPGANGDTGPQGLGYVIGTPGTAGQDPESGDWSFQTSSVGAFASGDYVRVEEDSSNYILGTCYAISLFSGSYYMTVTPDVTVGTPDFDPSFSVHLAGKTGPTGATGPVAGDAYQVVYKDSSNNPAGSVNLQYDTSTGLVLEGDLRVDGAGISSTTLKVDATNHRVGIGKYDPGTALDVNGTVTATNFTGSPLDGTTTTAASGVGYMGLPQNASLTSNIAVVASDAGKHIYSTATRTATIPANSNVAMPIGTTIVFVAGSGATVTIAITSDTMYLAGPGTTGSRTLAPFGMATAVKIASTTWIISGNGLT